MLVPLERALAELRGRMEPVEPRSLHVEAAAGRVLAQCLQSSAAVPARAIALRDGWAVAAADVIGASSYSPVAMAKPPDWVETGAPMPAGTDAVLPPDGVTAGKGVAEVVAETAPGEGVRRPGEDARAGAILREAGERMRPGDIALALAVGIKRIRVREARVRILSLPGASPLEATCELVARFAEGAGARVERTALSSRDAEAITRALTEKGADLILVVGSRGHGPGDYATEVLASSGSLIANGLALRPGETGGCGLSGTTPVILVPDRLEAALAVMLTLVVPCLDHLMKATPCRPTVSGSSTRKVASMVGVTDLVLLRELEQGLEPLATGDLTLTAIAAADAWLAVPPGSEGFAAGETVTAFSL